MNSIYRVYYFLNHILTARNTNGFGVHSPFVFQFTRYVISEKNPFYIFVEIEKIRNKWLKINSEIEIEDFGTRNNKIRTISDIASKSLIRPKYGRLLFRIINYYKLTNLLELGTSLGISTAYIASCSCKDKCITLEGCKNTAEIAQKTFDELNLKNVEIIIGNINNTIEVAINKLSSVDFVYFDANHSQEGTISYFETILPFINTNSILVFDDIYWSKGMKNAWEIIKSNNKVTSTIDLFQIGIVFFNPDLNKKHYKMIF